MVRITEETRREDHAVPPSAERPHTGFNAASSQVSVESKHLLHIYYFNRFRLSPDQLNLISLAKQVTATVRHLRNEEVFVT